MNLNTTKKSIAIVTILFLMLVTLIVPQSFKAVYAPLPTATVHVWNITPTIGHNPDHTVEDTAGITQHVATTANPQTVITTIDNTSHPEGPCGLIFWNPATNVFQWYGIGGGFTAGDALNHNAPTLTGPAGTAFGAPTFQPGDVWVTINGSPPLYVNFKGTNNFRFYTSVTPSNGVKVDETTGRVYFSSVSFGTISRLNPVTDAVTTWSIGGHPHYLAIDSSGRVYSAVASAGVAGGLDAIVRIDPASGTVVSWAVPGGGLQSTPSDDTPDGVNFDSAGNLWFTMASSTFVGRLNPMTGEIAKFTTLGVMNPQLIASTGSGASLQSFFTEGTGNSVSIVTPTGATPGSDTFVTPSSLTVTPTTSTTGFADSIRTPLTTTITPLVVIVPGVGGTGGIVRFSPMPTPLGGNPVAPNHPSGMTGVVLPNTVFGSYLDPAFAGNSAVFQVTSPAIVAPPPPPPIHPTSTTVNCSPNPTPVNAPTTCTATVTDTSSVPTTPTGTVSFTTNKAGSFSTTMCTLAGTGSSASCSVTYTPSPGSEGTHTITGTYGGDLTHSGSQGRFDLTVIKRSTSTSVSCSPNFVQPGVSTTCQATVTDTSPGTPITPTGTVTWSSSGAGTFSPSNSCTLSGAGATATCTVTYTPSSQGTQVITATYQGDRDHFGSSGSTELAVGVHPRSAVTDSSLCSFDTDPNTFGQQFTLIYIQDASNPGTYELTASNPGQFYYNVFYNGPAGSPVTLQIRIPYPFITQGAVPIQEFGQFGFTSQGCFIPSDQLSGFTATPNSITLSSYTPQAMGSFVTITVSGTVPSTGLVYVTIHLNYGFKGTTGYSDVSNNAVNTDTSKNVPQLQSYTFSFNTVVGVPQGDTQTIQSENVFKGCAKGFCGMVMDSQGTPVSGATVQVFSSSGQLLGTVQTDQYGFYSIPYTLLGTNLATFTIAVPSYSLQQTVTLAVDTFTVTNFTTP